MRGSMAFRIGRAPDTAAVIESAAVEAGGRLATSAQARGAKVLLLVRGCGGDKDPILR